MPGNPVWDPEQYLRFGEERLRPALDLLARVAHPGPRRVVDLGCGAGSAMPALRARFPGAELRGVDGSASMLDKARAAGFETERADIAHWAPAEPVDVLFSNAALHWLPDHGALFPRLLGTLAPGGGVLAVQMPHMHAAPVRAAQDRLAAEGPWAGRLSGVKSAPPVPDAAEYYDLLAPRTAALDIWCAEYLHVLRGEAPVARWAMGSSLRPYLDALDGKPELRKGFLAAYTEETRRAYPPRADGAVLLPFRRLFILARV
ncbi:MAG: Trans-aconitate 2-methyltransferase [uncultured Acetobacteraceae bacterium]|uniref:Trans-aconitate 2-methyltransferase n=1 Tax=uncultured Acetobacteraceae bacterium TaxID=169975 RepID=A0A6J4IHZ6_9PROT|nr:MAG: Trans-aconitate 2-methyltransferase [uncultured Acetobacteraceae bacterium]